MPCNQIKKILEEGGSLLDVRTPREFAAGSIPGSTNVPLNGIPGVMQTLAKDKPVLLYCHSGARSGMAQRYLVQEGYDAHNIGGYQTYAQC